VERIMAYELKSNMFYVIFSILNYLLNLSPL